MNTRKDYLDGKCTHDEYYSQFVTSSIINMVVQKFGAEVLKREYKKDEYFNGLRLAAWDNMTHFIPRDISIMLRSAGDYMTLAGGVCILKQAAKMFVLNKKSFDRQS